MESAKKHLTSRFEDKVNNLQINPHPSGSPSFYECFTIHGFQIQKLQRGHVVCSWTVPARLTDASGTLYAGVIATIVDDIGCVAALADNQPQKVSVDMNISYISTAKVNDKIEVDAKILGHKGGFSMTYVNLRNKATGEVIAEGRHALYGHQTSKL